MKSFHDTYEVTNGATVQYLIKKLSETHEVIQKLEAGAEATKLQQAEATFMFLSLIGFYPTSASVDGVSRPLAGQFLVSDEAEENFYVIFKFADNGGESVPVSMFGSMMNDPTVTLMPESVVAYLIDRAIPGAVIQKTLGTSKDGSSVSHITVRPEFMQHKDYNGFPVESGSAICSNESVALMQAFIRMLAMHLVGHQWANEMQANMELAEDVEDLEDELLARDEADQQAKMAKLRDDFEAVAAKQKAAYMKDHGSHPLAEQAWDLSEAALRLELFGVVK